MNMVKSVVEKGGRGRKDRQLKSNIQNDPSYPRWD